MFLLFPFCSVLIFVQKAESNPRCESLRLPALLITPVQVSGRRRKGNEGAWEREGREENGREEDTGENGEEELTGMHRESQDTFYF